MTDILRFDPAHSVHAMAANERIFVFSDLHVGGKKKNHQKGIADEEIASMLTAAMDEADRMVFAGDMVELLNAVKSDSAVEDALSFLERLCRTAKEKNCPLEFLLGNHEYGKAGNGSRFVPGAFLDGLQRLEKEYAGYFRLHPVAFRMGDEKESVVIWHGDTVLRHQGDAPLGERLVQVRDQVNGKRFSFRERSCRLKAQLQAILVSRDGEEMLAPLEAQNGRAAIGKVARICFGHTHDPFVGARLTMDSAPGLWPARAEDRLRYGTLLHLLYDNPGTAETTGRCFPVLYTREENGRLRACQYEARHREDAGSWRFIETQEDRQKLPRMR